MLRRARLPIRLLAPALAVAAGACSAFQPADTGGPRSSQPNYPVSLPEDAQLAEEALVMWQRLAPSVPAAERAEIKLNRYTATIESLPSNSALYLPKVGTNPVLSEEELRESLRRFINTWQKLIGANPDQLSLVERTDEKDGSKLARYEQHPFRYPLRGPYGKLRIRSGSDRRILDFNSTCLPKTDRLQTALNAITPQLTWEQAVARVTTLNVAPVGTHGTPYQLSPSNSPQIRELVVYVRDPSSGGNSLEIFLAWEIAVTNAPFKLVYLDSVRGDIIATA
jgi:hypothetical protein